MKVAAIIFTVLGMAVNFSYGQNTLWFALIGVGVGVWMLVTLGSNKKMLAAGILGILFTGLLGGIFYLCWNPERDK